MKHVLPPRIYVVLGLVLFILGLLTILSEPTLYWLVSQIAPNSQGVLVFGAVVQTIGQAILLFGVIKMNSTSFLSSLQNERQLTTTILAKNMEQIQAKMQNERQALMASDTQTMAKLDSLMASRNEAALTVKASAPRKLPILRDRNGRQQVLSKMRQSQLAACLRHESSHGFVEYACSIDQILYCYSFINSMHTFFQLVVRLVRNHRLEPIADASCFSKETRISSACSKRGGCSAGRFKFFKNGFYDAVERCVGARF